MENERQDADSVAGKPSADDWLFAVLHVHDQYPEDVFPPTSTSPDAQAGTWARKVCENIMLEAYRRHSDGDVATSSGSTSSKLVDESGAPNDG